MNSKKMLKLRGAYPIVMNKRSEYDQEMPQSQKPAFELSLLLGTMGWFVACAQALS